MKIEVLYDNVCGLYGDTFNMKYLSMCSDSIELVKTNLGKEPHFVKEKVNMIYIGSMTEKAEEIVIKELMPYRKKIIDLINSGVIFLVTGNAIEVFGKEILRNGKCIEGLNIFDYITKYNYENRYHNLYLGKYKNINIIGFKSQFSKLYNVNEEHLFKTVKGMGNNETSNGEGIKKNNFMATNVLGPILLQNPYFVRELLKLLNLDDKLKYESEIIKSYNIRLDEYKKLNF